MIKKLTFLLFLLTFAFLAQVNAQSAVAPDKQAAIKELVALLNADNKAEDTVRILSAQVEITSKAIYTAMLDERKDLTPSERKSLEEDFAVNRMEAIKRFQDKFMQKLNYDEMIDEISIAIYDRHYTLEEIKDLTAFYKSPTGQKTLRLMPTVMTESMQSIQEKVLPKIPVIIKEIEEEIRRDAEQKINARKPRPKQPAGK